MAPNSTDAAIVEATKDTAFLATCFMNLKSKPQVDHAAVASKLSMSVGGVRNKLRPIIKSMEDAGALWTTDQPATPNPEVEARPKKAARPATPTAKRGRQAKDKENGEDDTSKPDETPSKKSKPSPKIVSKDTIEVAGQMKQESERTLD